MDVARPQWRSGAGKAARKWRRSSSTARRPATVLVEIKATGICHTDEFTPLGRPTRKGLFPTHPRA